MGLKRSQLMIKVFPRKSVTCQMLNFWLGLLASNPDKDSSKLHKIQGKRDIKKKQEKMLERSQKFLLEYVNKLYIFNSSASLFNLKQKQCIQKACRH